MQISQIHRSQSLRRVQAYLTAHADALQGANASDPRHQLDTAVTAFDAAAAEQGTSDREVRGEVQRRASLEHTLIRKYLSPLSKFARASLKGVPEYAALTPSAKQLQRERVITAARAMALAADKHTAELTAAKFPPQFLAQLRAMADSIQVSLDTRAARMVVRNGATKKIEMALVQGRRAVAALDSVVGHLILGDDRLEREWASAKRVRQTPVATPTTQPAAPVAPATTVTLNTPASTAAPEVTKAAA